jgi:hypothetical protein
MAITPKLSDVPRIRTALKLYKVSAYVTGILLLLLVLEMTLKYTGIHREIYLGSSQGFIALVPWNPIDIHNTVSGINLSTGILIAVSFNPSWSRSALIKDTPSSDGASATASARSVQVISKSYKPCSPVSSATGLPR